MNWKEVTVEVNVEAAEALAVLLQEKASGGVVIFERGERIGITAYFSDNDNIPSLIEELRDRVNKLNDFGLSTGKVVFTIKTSKDKDWASSWHRFFKPVKVGKKFIICPDWEKCITDSRYLIQINPGMAFGIGSHESSKICIELMEKHLTSRIKNLLDIGTGTGILAIAAAYLGVDSVLAIDIDSGAVEAARENVKKNGVSNKVIVRQGDLATDIGGKYQVLVANLLPNLIIRLLPSVLELITFNSKIILSGIINEKKKTVIVAAEEFGLKLIDELVMGEWIGLVFKSQ